jgi:ABC-type nitrate/sulfonate/bicarbonate transport system ATPase subunit
MTSDAAPGPGYERAVEFDAVSHSYAARGASVQALDDVSVGFDRGEFVSVVGPSGCGKTTLLKLLAGFEQPTRGEVRVDGVAVRGPSYERGVVFQAPELYPWLSVRGNVEFGPRMRRVGRAERRKVADEHLQLVGLAGFEERSTYELSGGMQQRCQIARVLANDPEIMLMDEPFGALDAFTRERLQAELRRLWRTTRKTVLFITHSVEEAALLSTRIIVLSSRPGRVILNEVVPFANRDDDLDALRVDPEFIELQAKVRKTIHDTAALADRGATGQPA